MIEFIDGKTPINRDKMMAVQGFVGKTTMFNENGTIVETNSNGERKITVFNDDGSITETFVGEKTITKTTKFMSDWTIKEELS